MWCGVICFNFIVWINRLQYNPMKDGIVIIQWKHTISHSLSLFPTICICIKNHTHTHNHNYKIPSDDGNHQHTPLPIPLPTLPHRPLPTLHIHPHLSRPPKQTTPRHPFRHCQPHPHRLGNVRDAFRTTTRVPPKRRGVCHVEILFCRSDGDDVVYIEFVDDG